MIEIKDLLARFDKILSNGEFKKHILKEVLFEVVGIEVRSDDIKIKNNIVYLNIKPLYKNEIFLKKEKNSRVLKNRKKKNLLSLNQLVSSRTIFQKSMPLW